MSTIAHSLKTDATRRVARVIKDRRKQQGLALRALAAKSGVSASMISDIERGAKSPTVATLSAIAEALGLSISAMVEQAPLSAGRFRVVRATERPDLVDPHGGARRKSIAAAVAGGRTEFLRYAVPPHRVAGPFAAHEHGTIEHMYVAQGSVRIIYGADEMTLKEGDSCTVIADAPHRFDNRKGRTEALIYLVVERP